MAISYGTFFDEESEIATPVVDNSTAFKAIIVEGVKAGSTSSVIDIIDYLTTEGGEILSMNDANKRYPGNDFKSDIDVGRARWKNKKRIESRMLEKAKNGGDFSALSTFGISIIPSILDPLDMALGSITGSAISRSMGKASMGLSSHIVGNVVENIGTEVALSFPSRSIRGENSDLFMDAAIAGAAGVVMPLAAFSLKKISDRLFPGGPTVDTVDETIKIVEEMMEQDISPDLEIVAKLRNNEISFGEAMAEMRSDKLKNELPDEIQNDLKDVNFDKVPTEDSLFKEATESLESEGFTINFKEASLSRNAQVKADKLDTVYKAATFCLRRGV